MITLIVPVNGRVAHQSLQIFLSSWGQVCWCKITNIIAVGKNGTVDGTDDNDANMHWAVRLGIPDTAHLPTYIPDTAHLPTYGV